MRDTRVEGDGRRSVAHVVLDIFSRFVVAWTVAAREDFALATEMLEEPMGVHGVPEVVHADRGTSMTSKPVAQLLVDLGVTRSHSRPHVSNDNPYSEAAFKTLKYAPVFPRGSARWPPPERFGERFFGYYNHEHRHSGIGLHTPASVHHGTAGHVRALRQATLDAAYAAKPERFATADQHPRNCRTGLAQPALTRGSHTDQLTAAVSSALTGSGPRASKREPPGVVTEGFS